MVKNFISRQNLLSLYNKYLSFVLPKCTVIFPKKMKRKLTYTSCQTNLKVDLRRTISTAAYFLQIVPSEYVPLVKTNLESSEIIRRYVENINKQSTILLTNSLYRTTVHFAVHLNHSFNINL